MGGVGEYLWGLRVGLVGAGGVPGGPPDAIDVGAFAWTHAKSEPLSKETRTQHIMLYSGGGLAKYSILCCIVYGGRIIRVEGLLGNLP